MSSIDELSELAEMPRQRKQLGRLARHGFVRPEPVHSLTCPARIGVPADLQAALYWAVAAARFPIEPYEIGVGLNADVFVSDARCQTDRLVTET